MIGKRPGGPGKLHVEWLIGSILFARGVSEDSIALNLQHLCVGMPEFVAVASTPIMSGPIKRPFTDQETMLSTVVVVATTATIGNTGNDTPHMTRIRHAQITYVAAEPQAR